MDRAEYRRQNLERKTGLYSAAAGFAAGADALAYDKVGLTEPVAESLQTLVLGDLPWSGSATAIAAAGCLTVLPVVTRARRRTKRWKVRDALRAPEWADKSDRKQFIGLPACREDAVNTRPDLTKRQRAHAPAHEVGVPIGTTISGKRTAWQRLRRSGHLIAVPFSTAGMLVLGEPGSRKSTFLAGVAAQTPGPTIVVSTKAEFMRGWEGRAARGPVAAFAPLESSAEIPDKVSPLSWSLVRGCRDVSVAQQRAQDLMEATASSGLENAGFWDSMSKAVITAMLVAADLRNANLRDVAAWIQLHKYEPPIKTLEVARDNGYKVEDSLINGLVSMSDPDNPTARSAAATAGNVLKFLQSGALADALSPGSAAATDPFEDPKRITAASIAPVGELHEGETDLHDLIRKNGTLYIVTDRHDAMPPLVNALWGALQRAAIAVALEDDTSGQQQKRLARPLVLIADEVSSTMSSVPLDQHAAELRGYGIYIIAATQNRAKLTEVWGETRAKAMAGSLQTHVILSLADVDDRKHYSQRLGSRSVDVIKTSRSTPAHRRLFPNMKRAGHSLNHTPETETRDLWPHEAWGYLRPGEAVVIPTRGSAAVVRFGNGWLLADKISKQSRESDTGGQWQDEEQQMMAAAAAHADEWSAAQRQRQENGETPKREWWEQ